MDSLLEHLKQGFILTVDAKSEGAFPNFADAKVAAARHRDAGHKPVLHITDYTTPEPHAVWHFSYEKGDWIRQQA